MNPGESWDRTLARAWQAAAEAGKLAGEFAAPGDDPAGRWRRGETVVFGIRVRGRGYQGAPALGYFAENRSSGQPIMAEIKARWVGERGFRCQYHGYRALRPGGRPARPGRQPDIPEGAAACRFYCQDPAQTLSLARREALLESRPVNQVWRAYANAAPFASGGHVLWAPGAPGPGGLPHYPQRLTAAMWEDLWAIIRRAGEWMVFYNSLHAGASVNHLHAQAILPEQPPAVGRAGSERYRGVTILRDYPAQALVFDATGAAREAFLWIDRLQQAEVPFNLVSWGGRVLLFPRDPETEVVAEWPGGVVAALELAGQVVTVNEDVYAALDEAAIQAVLRRATVSVRELVDRWG